MLKKAYRFSTLQVLDRLVDNLDDRKAESASLSTASFRGHENIATTQDERYGFALNVCRQNPVHLLDRLRKLWQYAHFCKN